MEVIRTSEGETSEGSAAAIFEGGQVWARRLAGGDTGRGRDISFGIVHFAAGARAKPHRHSSDQLLYVVSGIGKVGAGGEEHRIGTGDFVLIPAGEDHWHGAADTGSPMAHITVTAGDSETTVLA